MSDSDIRLSVPAVAGAGVIALSAGALGGAPYCAFAAIASAPKDATSKVLVMFDFILDPFAVLIGIFMPPDVGCGANKRRRLRDQDNAYPNAALAVGGFLK